MITTSESTKELNAALAKAQKDIGFALKDSTNPFFKSKYADLVSVWKAVQDPLSENGLSVSQSPGVEVVNNRTMVSVTTRVQHSSGEWMQGTCYLPPGKEDAQAYGAAITYGRRYALSSFLGVIQDDDDGETAVGRGKATESPKPEAKPAPKKSRATAQEKPGSKDSPQSGTPTKEKLTGVERLKDLALFMKSHGAENKVEAYDFLLLKCQGSVDANPTWAEIKADESINTDDIKSSITAWVKANHMEPKNVFATLSELAEKGVGA